MECVREIVAKIPGFFILCEGSNYSRRYKFTTTLYKNFLSRINDKITTIIPDIYLLKNEQRIYPIFNSTNSHTNIPINTSILKLISKLSSSPTFSFHVPFFFQFLPRNCRENSERIYIQRTCLYISIVLNRCRAE